MELCSVVRRQKVFRVGAKFFRKCLCFMFNPKKDCIQTARIAKIVHGKDFFYLLFLRDRQKIAILSFTKNIKFTHILFLYIFWLYIHCRVQRFWHFLRKWRVRTHSFCEPYRARLAPKFAKSAYMTPQNFCHNNSIRVSKTQNLTLISNLLKKFGKKL